MIGDRFDLVVDVEKDLVQVVQFPEFEDKPGNPIELHKEYPIDTLERDGRHLKLRKRYTLAAFEEGKWNLGRPAVLYADKNIVDTLWARDSLYLEVATFQIDSTSQSIYDVKPQWNLPFRFGEVSGYAQWGALALVLLLAAAYALKRYLESRGKRLGDLFRPSPPQPPHVVAIKALEALHHQKLWQNNKHKQYYSALTDILRTYVAARWGFGAMEMTSDEIIEAMRAEELPDKAAALAHFTAMSDKVYPAFAGVLGGQKPTIKVRSMTSRWGVCHMAKRQITFALQLYNMPEAAQIYVVVHEYCHFLQPNHSPAFWAEVAKLLPDWKARRELLKK